MTLDFIFTTCTGHNTRYWFERDELDSYNSYADGSDHGKGILSANWNNFPHGARQWVKGEGYPDTIVTPDGIKQNGTSSEAHRRFERILETMGYQLEWSDQTSRCEDCNGCIVQDTGWQTSAIIGECSEVCVQCIRKDPTEYLESIADSYNLDVCIYGVNPAEYGYVKIATGWRSDRDKMASEYKKQGYSGLLFTNSESSMEYDLYASHMPSMTQYQQFVECGSSIEIQEKR